MSSTMPNGTLSTDRLAAIVTELLNSNPRSVKVVGSSAGHVTVDLNGHKQIARELQPPLPEDVLDLSGVQVPPGYKTNHKTEEHKGIKFTYITYEQVSGSH